MGNLEIVPFYNELFKKCGWQALLFLYYRSLNLGATKFFAVEFSKQEVILLSEIHKC